MESDCEKLAHISQVTSVEEALKLQLQSVSDGLCDKLAWRALEVQEHFRILWKYDGKFLKKVFPLFNDSDVCFSYVFII